MEGDFEKFLEERRKKIEKITRETYEKIVDFTNEVAGDKAFNALEASGIISLSLLILIVGLAEMHVKLTYAVVQKIIKEEKKD